MLCYDRTDLIEEIGLAKSSCCKECVVCYYWSFIHRFKF